MSPVPLGPPLAGAGAAGAGAGASAGAEGMAGRAIDDGGDATARLGMDSDGALLVGGAEDEVDDVEELEAVDVAEAEIENPLGNSKKPALPVALCL